MSSSIEPYKVSVPEHELQSLHQKLSIIRFPDELDGAGNAYGAPLNDIKRLTAHWKNKFDWRAAEAKINELPQFTTHIQAGPDFDALRIHFVHQKSPVDGAIPLLFSHGWPGSFIEVQKILPLLMKGDGKSIPAFHVIAPSLPNFGFSEGTKKKEFGLKEYASTLNQLMLRLGYKEYVTQGLLARQWPCACDPKINVANGFAGGDWGWWITRAIGLFHPGNCKASHINMIYSPNPPAFTSQPILALQHAVTPYTEREKDGLKRSEWFENTGSGYRILQASKPQTLGYSLADSPVGLLGWIYEKLIDWTDSYPWTDDEVLTWISIYWFSVAGPAASVRIYYETRNNPEKKRLDIMRTTEWIDGVKLGLMWSPKELVRFPNVFGRTLGPVVYESDNEAGGHFAATEHPDWVVRDLQKMFGRSGGAFGVVKGKNGYAGRDSKL